MSRGSYYNENDPYCAQWLRDLIDEGLIADGDVDDRDIRDVRPSDLRGYRQAHFFAGLGGWSYALRLAGWPDDRPVWTGSCPCQPFSSAGTRQGFADERHLWPDWHWLIKQCCPAVLFGEQVARAAEWLALVHGDLEALDYAVGALPIEAASVGAPHLRDRFWFVAHAIGQRKLQSERCQPDERRWLGDGGAVMAHTASGRCQSVSNGHAKPNDAHPSGANVADTAFTRQQINSRWREKAGQPWHGSIGGGGGPARADEHWRVEPDVGRVAHGIPARVGKLRALGNAIVPQVAAEFIRAVM